MAPENRRANALEKKIRNEYFRFSFFRLVQLLEKLAPEDDSPNKTPFEKERIRYRPGVSLAFPASKILGVEELVERPQSPHESRDETARRYEVMLSFFGLYGAGSPLPSYFSRIIAAREPGWQQLKDFLDIFNHRFYALYYQAWKRNRHHLAFQPEASDRISQNILCLCGLGANNQPDHAGLAPVRLLAAAGMIGRRAKCAEGLEQVISSYFAGLTVRVKQFLPRWEKNPIEVKLGETGFRLGINTTIGRQVLDLAGKIRVTLGPVTAKRLKGFTFRRVPHARADELVALERLISLYTADTLDFEIEIILATAELPALKLGDTGRTLGYDTFLGKPREKLVAIRMQ